MSDIDWDTIKVRYAKGDTAYKISNDMGGRPSKVGIQKRANREGWIRPDPEIADGIKNLALVQATSKLPRKRTPENVNLLLQYLNQGVSDEIAARAVGICPKTLSNWKSDDAEFARLCDVAKAQKQAEWISKIDQSKDWKAQYKLLQSSKETKEQFSERHDKKMPTIILNIHRDPVDKDGTVIEGECT